MFVNILASSIATLIALEYFGVGGVSAVLAVFTVLLILVGEILPKVIAVRINETFSLVTAVPLRLFSILFFPLRIVAQKITDQVLSWIPSKKKFESVEQISQEDLKALIKIGEREGVLDGEERHMMQKLFELGERPVKDIMTPRVDLKVLDFEDSREEHIEIIRKYHKTRFPVYQESRDNILGVVSAQEYVLHPELKTEELIKQPLFIPETKRIDDLLAEFRTKNEDFAICVDEYGGTAGVVTMEDILEEIFGEFYDEYAEVENPIRPYGPKEYLVEAKIPLSEFNEYFRCNLKAEEASTLGGFIFERLGEIPAPGKVVGLKNIEIRIHQVIRKRRLHRVVVKVIE